MSIDPRSGGTAERTVQMSRHLHKIGQDVRLLVTDKNAGHATIDPLSCDRMTVLPLLNERYYIPRAQAGTVRQLVSQSDVIHVMNHWTVINAIVARAAWALGKPYVICPAGSLRIAGSSKWLKQAYHWVIGAKIIDRASFVIAITPTEHEEFNAFGVPSEKIVVIPNAVDFDDFAERDDSAFRSQYQLSARPFILFLGRLHTVKGPDLLLDAYLELGAVDYDLVFAGVDDGLESPLRARAERSGASDRVHFIGHVASAAKSRALHAASMLVIPSRREAMSIVVLEAGAAGTPVLMTDQCGFNDVEAIGGGRVVPANATALRDGIRELMANRDALPEMGRRLHAHCETHFSWPARAREFVSLYERIVQ